MIKRQLLILLMLAASCGGSDAAGPISVTTTPAVPDPADSPSVEPVVYPIAADLVRGEAEPWTVEPREPRCLVNAATCYPIVLAHGFMANPEFLEFFGVADHLRAQGFVVVEAAVEPFDGVDVRGAMLAEQIVGITAALNVDKVNVIAQSMGGLDARYAISTMGVGDHVATLTTISTPHRGSAVADAFLDEAAANGDSPIAKAVLIALGTQYSEGVAQDPKLSAGLASLAEAAAPAFNAANPDDPSIVYESWAGLSNVFGISGPSDDAACENTFWNDNGQNDRMDALFIGTSPLVAHGAAMLPNDGMVTIESAKWGEFRGCIRADHADEVGQMQDLAPDPRTGFAHLEFYEFLAHDLATRGF